MYISTYLHIYISTCISGGAGHLHLLKGETPGVAVIKKRGAIVPILSERGLLQPVHIRLSCELRLELEHTHMRDGDVLGVDVRTVREAQAVVRDAGDEVHLVRVRVHLEQTVEVGLVGDLGLLLLRRGPIDWTPVEDLNLVVPHA